MRPLTREDLLPLEEFAARRRELFEAQRRYLDRYRQVRIGPRLALRFENRQTLWFRVQEVLHVARLAEPRRVQQQLDLSNRLLPRRDQLQAALLIELEDERRLTEELAFWQTLRGEEVRLGVGEQRLPSRLVTCRPEDRCLGAAHWVVFTLDAAGRLLLADFRRPAFCEVHHDAYHHLSAALADEVRQSLLDDLELSDRDGEAA
jgi:hypothetical protein